MKAHERDKRVSRVRSFKDNAFGYAGGTRGGDEGEYGFGVALGIVSDIGECLTLR